MSDVLDTPRAGGLVIRGGALRFASYVAGNAVTLVAAALLIRHLGASAYGRYIAVFSLVTIVGSITEAGLTNLGVRDYAATERSERDRLMAVLLGLRLALTALGVLAAIAFAAIAGYGADLVLGTALAGVGLLLQIGQATYAIPLLAELLVGRATALELGRQAATSVLIVAGVAAGAGVVVFLAVPVPVGVVLLVATAWLVRGRIPLRPRFDPAAWRRMFEAAAAFALASAVGIVYIYLAIILLSLIADDAQTGYFGASFRVFMVVATVPGLVVAIALPVLARAAFGDRERLRYAVQRLLETSVVLGVAGALATIVGAPVAIEVIGGAELEPAIDVLRVQGLAVLASFVLAPWGYALISLHAHRPLLWANAAALLVSVALVLTLGEAEGAQGAAWATVAGEITLAAAYAVALFRVRPDLRPALDVPARVTVAAAPAVALAVLLDLPSLPLTLLCLLVYGAGVLALRAIPPELRERVPGLRP